MNREDYDSDEDYEEACLLHFLEFDCLGWWHSFDGSKTYYKHCKGEIVEEDRLGYPTWRVEYDGYENYIYDNNNGEWTVGY